MSNKTWILIGNIEDINIHIKPVELQDQFESDMDVKYIQNNRFNRPIRFNNYLQELHQDGITTKSVYFRGNDRFYYMQLIKITDSFVRNDPPDVSIKMYKLRY